MSAQKVAPPQTVRLLTDDPAFEGQAVRGVVFGLLIATLAWLFVAALALAVVKAQAF